MFLIRALSTGGAERQLIELVKRLDPARFQTLVVTFYPWEGGEDALRLPPTIRHVSLAKQGRWDVLGFMWRLHRTGLSFRPHIIHGYLSGANEFALITGKLIGSKVVWGLRASNVNFAYYNWLYGVSFQVGAWLSSWADLLITNSQAGRDHYLQHGYVGGRMLTIPNGIDTNLFRPDPPAGEQVRREWGLHPDEFLVGVIGRLDPMKDHRTFLQMAALLTDRLPQARFICVGDGPHGYWREMRALSESLGLQKRMLWTGTRQDMPAVYNALDLLCSSSSFGEGFSNVIGEAMACGVPCVVTDVGDSRLIVGETGEIVPPKNPQALAEAIIRMASISDGQRREFDKRARQRIEENYSAEMMAASTAAIFNELVPENRRE